MPIAFESEGAGSNFRITGPSPGGSEKVVNWANSLRGNSRTVSIDVEANQVILEDFAFVSPSPGTIWERGNSFTLYSFHEQPLYRQWSSSEAVGSAYTLPAVMPGAGLSWLALPIPLLGIIGLVGLLFLLGQRGVPEALGYTLLVSLALTLTLLPFFAGTSGAGSFTFSALGVVCTPVPSFEQLLAGFSFGEDWLLVFGLLLSAGIPWLLAGWFLRVPEGNWRDNTPLEA